MPYLTIALDGQPTPLTFEGQANEVRHFAMQYEKGTADGRQRFVFRRHSAEGGVLTTVLFVDLSKVSWITTETEEAAPKTGAAS